MFNYKSEFEYTCRQTQVLCFLSSVFLWFLQFMYPAAHDSCFFLLPREGGHRHLPVVLLVLIQTITVFKFPKFPKKRPWDSVYLDACQWSICSQRKGHRIGSLQQLWKHKEGKLREVPEAVLKIPFKVLITQQIQTTIFMCVL